METSSSSKVTVEYHDPSGVFPLISNELNRRLPLRNLNWQSHARPLRQIKHLHIEFVPSQETLTALRPQAQNGAPGTTSIDILRSGFEAPTPTTKAIRHQIAGLKATPYLKVYILRCDDKEWYKQEERRRLKDWLREIKEEDGRQEHHDAAEWLIVHVVIPDTIAASEPRWRESSRDPDELKERSKANGTKWPGKSGKTMLDRLRADFNEGKNNDHVAQIRLSKSQIAVDLLPVPALAKSVEETADEREKSWADLMLKIRTSILASFDSRVRQYEEDVAEQESRRTLPGWNFCTFFINKEGLAKSLESVGLVEDALAIYDELSLDLETMLTDIATGHAEQTATSFSVTGSDVVDRIIKDADSGRLFAKDYREEIVRSAISAFDFFCYLFERQLSLILRLAGKTTAASGMKEGGDDLVMLAEVCWRGLNFIHNGARLLKQDLFTKLSATETHALTLSWTYAAAEFVLARAQSYHLDLTDAGIQSPGKAINGEPKPLRREFGFSMGADAYPQRNSSLPLRKTAEIKSVTSTSSAGRASEDGFLSPPSSSGGDGSKSVGVPGLTELAAYRAELIVLQRKTLDLLAAMKGWYAGWAALRSSPVQSEDTTLRLGHEVATILCMKEAYQSKYAVLTEIAARHYLLATHQKTAENLMGDLALLKYTQGDYESAATYVEHILPMFETDGWQHIQIRALALHVDCLTKLERWSEAVEASLELLAQTIQSGAVGQVVVPSATTANSWRSLLTLSEQLQTPHIVPMSRYAEDVYFSQTISHADGIDGFSHKTSLTVLAQDLEAERLELVLQSVDHPGTTFSLNHGPVSLQQGTHELTFTSNVTTFGMYAIDRLDIFAKKLILRHELGPRQQSDGLQLTNKEPEDKPEEKRPCLLVYPAADALAMRAMLCRETSVHKARYLDILLKTGQNEIDQLEVRIKPNTAGLRLHCNDAKIVGVDAAISSGAAGTISIERLNRAATATIRVRYSLDLPVPDIALFAEMQYTTPQGAFVALQHFYVPTLLSLDVEVKDTFHHQSLLSSFTIKSTNTHPVVLESVNLQESQAYSVTDSAASTPAIILPTQPFECLYKIIRKSSQTRFTKQEAAMDLIVKYWPIGDLIRTTIAKTMRASLRSSKFAALRRLIMPLLLARCLRTLTDADLHVAALTQDTKVPSFADLGWFDIVDAMPEAEQRPLSDWLMQWHIKHQRMPLAQDAVNVQKQIVITVDVPAVDHVFLASLSIGGKGILRQGEPVSTQLKIRYTRMWQSQGPTKSSRRPDFVYELLVDPNAWVLSGGRRMRFSAEEDEDMITTEVQLLPLKPGRWALPNVLIRPELEDDAKLEVSFEASCTSAGHVVQVVGSEQTSRVIAVKYEKEPLHVAAPGL